MRPPDKSARRRSKEVKPQVQRRHRRVQDGKMTGFGSANGLDVAAYAADNGYIVNAAGYTTADNHKIYYDEAAGSLVIETSLVDDKVWWELRQGSRLITRRPFDKLYVDIEIDVYLAPNGRQGVVVMHLNAGYIVDAAIYAFKLRKRAVTAKPQSTDQ